MSEAYNKLTKTLQTIFEMDKADLDFGIYRIMNQKRDDINQFLEEDLLPQVKQAFADYAHDGQDDLQKELETVIEQARKLGAPDPENTEAAQEIKKKLASAVDATALENDVFSKLHTFFSRYYDKGDFISQRRYKKDTYAIPYEGEEVKLYWANHDQYYIKSSEHLRDYAFIAKDKEDKDKSFRIKLVEADTEKDNVKAKSGEERRFVLDEENPLSIENGELLIHFNFIPVGKKKQDALNKAAAETIFKQEGEEYAEWLSILSTPAPTEKNPNRTLLEKHLNDYTARNTFDYFIHKDLGGFLNRELDFFIKNEVLHLDDIDDAAFEVTEQQLRKIKILRSIAKKIIRMLAQLEDFQKKLWLKKKFVVETNYCITLDRIPKELIPEVMANDTQRQEWVELFAINKEKLEKDLLDNNPEILLEIPEYKYLVVDTRFYTQEFKDNLLSAIENIDSKTNGLVIYSENFQALNTIANKYQASTKCIYIDPPYNTDVSSIPYKNDYRHSSWGTMMRDKIALLKEIMSDDGAIYVSIDKTERTILEYAMDSVFGRDNKVEELIWVQNTNDGRSPTFSTNHEYIEVYSKDKPKVESDFDMFREPKPGFREIMDLVSSINPSFPSIDEIRSEIRKLYSKHKNEYKQDIEQKGLDWEVEKRNDPWKGIYNYNRAEYRDSNGKYVDPDQASQRNATIWVWREDNWTIMSSDSKQSPTTKDPNHKNFRYYRPIHPITGKPCKLSTRGWKGTQFIDPEHPNRNSLESLMNDHRISFGEDENKVPQQKRFLHEVESNVCKSIFTDYSDGEKETTSMFGKSGLFLAPKHSKFVNRFIQQATNNKSYVLDCFGGSGSTAHAVINANREDSGNRKYITIEMGKHFETLLKPRLKKSIYSKDWALGKPTFLDTGASTGVSQIFKYHRLESYEDTLNNLNLKHSEKSLDLIDKNQKLREDYMLGYWLDVETADSPSLLNIDQFEDPFNYKLNIGSGSVGATKPTTVDLVETFNYLIGLTVKTIDVIRGFKVVTGANPKDESVLVVWRNLKEKGNAALEEFLDKQGYNPRDTEFEHIYVNGDHTLEDPQSKVKMIEIEFKRLMFDVKDV